ncbi:hypothetical protein MMC24_004170 [Lignoscripta atroalba]|nr:hypothetical protein [Lignoscripta atroalba]
MATKFKHTELFGGAIVVDLPEGYADVSNIRQVPDNQEVYLCTTGFTSIIFDITEHVSHLPTDEEALKYQLSDIVEAPDQVKVWSSNSARFSKFPPSTPACTLLATSTTTSPTPTTTTLILLLLRLGPPHNADIVITINIPTTSSSSSSTSSSSSQHATPEEINFPEGKLGNAVEEGITFRDEILRTLEVRDWGLFGGVGEGEGDGGR